MDPIDDATTPAELMARVRGLQIKTRRLVSELIGGHYRSAFRGSGLEFDEVREYSDGDDLSDLDWNVTARTGEPFVKVFREERERTVLLLLDKSASTHFGSGGRTKARLAAELCAVLALAAAGCHDRVGLLAFSDRIERFVPPRRGTQHARRVIRDILAFEATGRGTSLNTALERLAASPIKRAIVFLVSDFGDLDFERNAAILARRHDVTAVRIIDPRELHLPACGLITVRDSETGRTVTADLGSPVVRQRFADAAKREGRHFRDLCRRARVDHLELSTAEPFEAPLRAFLDRRGRRFGH